MSQSVIEEWMPVPEYEGLYEASSAGRVRRIAPTRYAGIRAPYTTGEGYQMISLSRAGERHRFQVGEIVCLAFIGPRPTPTHQCAHWDGNNAHNRPANLRWATPKENCADRERHGRTRRGETHPSTKLSPAAVRAIRQRYTPGLGQRLADEYAITRRQVCSIVNRASWKHLPDQEEQHV